MKLLLVIPAKAGIALALLFALLWPVSATARDVRPAHPPGVAIASAHALATEAGLEILREGGNAFDAAVAVSSTLSVVEPISSGLGGGGFFLLHDAKTGKDVFVDARETAPASATPEAYLDEAGGLNRDRATNGPWAAGIPGLPAALVHVAGKYGRLPLKDSLAPAIRIAREGFPMYARLVRGYGERREVMERYPGTRAVFLSNGQPPKEGTWKDIFLDEARDVVAQGQAAVVALTDIDEPLEQQIDHGLAAVLSGNHQWRGAVG